MKTLRTIWLRIRSLWQRPAAKREIDEELQFHIEHRTAQNRATGMSLEESAWEARKRFGNVQSVREGCRDVRGASFGDGLPQDIRFGLRMLRKNPGFTCVIVLSLALGIAANVMVFSVFNATFLRPVPGIEDPTRIVDFRRLDKNRQPTGFSYPDYETFRDHSSVFAGMFSWMDRDVRGEMITFGNGPADQDKAVGDANPEVIPALLVSDNYFSVLGVHAALGRMFLPEETKTPGSHSVVVLSHRLWQRRFGSDTGALGKTVFLNGVAFTIVGIAPASFCGFGDLRATDAWLPLTMAAELDRRANWADLKWGWRFQMAGRLKPGVSRREAEAASKVLHAQLTPPGLSPEERPSLRLQAAGTFAPMAESIGLVLPIMVAVSLVLVIACANAANLLLARAATRQREMGIRLAVGANRSRLIRQLMTESMLIALAGGALGLWMGFWFCSLAWRYVRQSLPELQRYLVDLNMTPDARAIAYVLLLCTLTAIVFGIAPAFAASRVNPNLALKDETPWSSQRFSRSWLRHALVIAQVAACLTLLVGVGQLLTASRRTAHVKLGYETRDVICARLDFVRNGYSLPRAVAFQNLLLERLRNLPGVECVSFAKNTLARNRHVDWVSPGYFETMGIPILRGRSFVEADADSGAPVAIVSEATARRLWPDKEAIGRRLTNAPFAEVIGVVGNVRNLRETMFRQPPRTPELPGAGRDDFLYLPAGTVLASGPLAVLVKTDSAATHVATALCDEVQRLDPALLVSAGALTQEMEEGLKLFAILEAVAGLIGLSALLLAAIGIYGVIACSVNQSTREIGIRVALGAQRVDVLRPILWKGFSLVLGGVALGFPAAFVLSSVLSSAMTDVLSLEPMSFLLASLWLGIVMLAACYLPARRAANADPMISLRFE